MTINSALKKIYVLISALFLTGGFLFARDAVDTTDYYKLAQSGSPQEIVQAFKKNPDLSRQVFGLQRESFLMMVLHYDRDLDVIKKVLQGDCSVNAITDDQKNAVMYAAQYTSRPEVLEYIIKAGTLFGLGTKSRVTKIDSHGMTAFDYARLNSTPGLLEILEKYGKEPSQEKKDKANKDKQLYGYVNTDLSGTTSVNLGEGQPLTEKPKEEKAQPTVPEPEPEDTELEPEHTEPEPEYIEPEPEYTEPEPEYIEPEPEYIEPEPEYIEPEPEYVEPEPEYTEPEPEYVEPEPEYTEPEPEYIEPEPEYTEPEPEYAEPEPEYIEPEPEYVEPEPLVLEAIEEEELEPLPQMEPEVKEGSSAEEEKPVIQEEKRPEPEALILEAVEDDGPGPLYQDEPKQVIETIEEEEPELVIQKVKADHESPVLETVEEEELEPLPQIEPEVREDSRVAEEKPVIQEEKAGEPLIQREEPLALVTEPNTRESKEEETKPRDEKKVESPKETIYDYIEEESIEPEPEQKTTALTDSADEYGVTQLMRAAMSGNDWQVRTLIEGGADVNARDVDEWTALMYASRYQQNVQIVRTLIESGAYVRVRNKYNVTPLLMAAEYSQNPEILSVLLEDRSASEEEVFKAFILTVSSGQVSPQITKSKIRIFLDKGIAINRIWKGKTALMYACQYATDTEIIQLLLDQGAKTSIRDSSGKTAFDYAKENRTLDHNDTYWSLNGGQ